MASIGDVLNGRYRLVRLRGQGGMSDVYEATDERSGAAVAVKVVRSDDPDLARRLQQEVRALGRVEHPGLVRLLDTGVVEGYAYLVMELVDGSTLAQLMREDLSARSKRHRSGLRWLMAWPMRTVRGSSTVT